MVRVKEKGQIPKGPHFVIMIYKPITVTQHGREEEILDIHHLVTEDRKTWVEAIESIELTKHRDYHARQWYVAFEVSQVATVTTQILVSFVNE
jgi:hypothetical protein